MDINIPNKSYQLIALIGIIMLGYSYYQLDREERTYLKKIDRYNELVDSMAITIFTRNYRLKEIKRKADLLSRIHGVDNPIIEVDSLIEFNRIINGTGKEQIVNDSIEELWEKFQIHKFKIELLEKKESIFENQIAASKRLKESYFDQYIELRDIGFFFLTLGLFIWVIDQPWNEWRKERKKQFDIVYPYCQSCGRKFSSILNYGTNKNKKCNYSFCEKCFKKGEFTNKELTMEEVMAMAQETTKHKNWIYKKLLKLRLSKLDRWKRNQY